MKQLLTIFILLISGSINAQNKAATSTADFANATGAWKGSITYLDYTSGKPFTMPANVVLRVAIRGQVILSYTYPEEPKANGLDTILVSANGSMVDGSKVVLREVMEDGAVKVVTERAGIDGNDNKPAQIRHIYYLGKKSFQSIKEVKFEGTDNWIKRNAYLFSR